MGLTIRHLIATGHMSGLAQYGKGGVGLQTGGIQGHAFTRRAPPWAHTTGPAPAAEGIVIDPRKTRRIPPRRGPLLIGFGWPP